MPPPQSRLLARDLAARHRPRYYGLGPHTLEDQVVMRPGDDFSLASGTGGDNDDHGPGSCRGLTKAKLDFGPWEQDFHGESGGHLPKWVL
jgi:hypothetical protein